MSAVLAKEPLDQYTGSESVKPGVSQAPPYLTKEENQLRLFLQLSAITYLVAGLAFAVFPEPILKFINDFADYFRPIINLGSNTE